MAITIRHGRRYRARQVFVGKIFTVSRYEREHEPAKWMFVIDDNIKDRAIEFDDEDATMLETDLREVADGKMSAAELEAKLKGYFNEAARQAMR